MSLCKQIKEGYGNVKIIRNINETITVTRNAKLDHPICNIFTGKYCYALDIYGNLYSLSREFKEHTGVFEDFLKQHYKLNYGNKLLSNIKTISYGYGQCMILTTDGYLYEILNCKSSGYESKIGINAYGRKKYNLKLVSDNVKMIGECFVYLKLDGNLYLKKNILDGELEESKFTCVTSNIKNFDVVIDTIFMGVNCDLWYMIDYLICYDESNKLSIATIAPILNLNLYINIEMI